MDKIYIQTDKRPKTVRELLRKLYSIEIVYNKVKRATSTYSNKECTILQCGPEKNRSFRDVYALCKTYFHNVSEKKYSWKCYFYITQNIHI